MLRRPRALHVAALGVLLAVAAAAVVVLSTRAFPPARADAPGTSQPQPRPAGTPARPLDLRGQAADRAAVRTLSADGRPFTLRLPPGRHRDLPVVIAVPGFNTEPSIWDTMVHLGEHAAADGFAVAYASGTGYSFNALICCGAAVRRHVDDEGYLIAIRRQLVASGVADPRRVYLLGFSNGDMLGLMTVCHHPDLFAAEAGASGDFPYATAQRCTGARVLHFHGTSDDVVRLGGGWNATLSMTSQPVATLPRRMAGATVTLRYMSCGHLFPTMQDPCGFDGVAAAWAFFRR